MKSKELGAVLPWRTRNNKPQKVIIAWLPHVPTSSRNDMVMSCHFQHSSDWWSLVSHRRRIGFRRMLLGIPQASEQASRFVASGASSRRGQPVSPRSDSADLTLAMEKTEGWEGNIVVMLWKSCSLYPREVIVCCLMLFSYVFHFHLHLLSKDYHRLSFFLISVGFSCGWLHGMYLVVH